MKEDTLKDYIKEQDLEPIYEEALVGAVDIVFDYVPILNKIYKIIKEKRLKKAIQEISKRIEKVEIRTNEETTNLLILKCLEEASETIQEEKIKYIVNITLYGFEQEDNNITLNYYEILKKLTLSDIDVLLKINSNNLLKKEMNEKQKVAVANLKSLGLIIDNKEQNLENYINDLDNFFEKILNGQYDYAGMKGKVLIKPNLHDVIFYYMTDIGKEFLKTITSYNAIKYWVIVRYLRS